MKEYQERTNVAPKITEDVFCLATESVNSYLGRGDSGGPVYDTNTLKLVGVAVLADLYPWERNDMKGPTVCAKVANYLDWITEKTNIQLGA